MMISVSGLERKDGLTILMRDSNDLSGLSVKSSPTLDERFLDMALERPWIPSYSKMALTVKTDNGLTNQRIERCQSVKS